MVAPASDTRMELICLGDSLRVWEDDRTTGRFVWIMPFIITLWTLVQVYASCEQLAFKPPADRVTRQGLLGLFLAHLDLLRRACFPCSDSVLFGAQLPAHLSSHNYVPEVGVLNPAESPSLFHQENPLQPQCICCTLWSAVFMPRADWKKQAIGERWWQLIAREEGAQETAGSCEAPCHARQSTWGCQEWGQLCICSIPRMSPRRWPRVVSVITEKRWFLS